METQDHPTGKLWTNDGPPGLTSFDLLLAWFSSQGQHFLSSPKDQQEKLLKQLLKQLPKVYTIGSIPLRTVETIRSKLSFMLMKYNSVCQELSTNSYSVSEQEELKKRKCPYFDQMNAVYSCLKRPSSTWSSPTERQKDENVKKIKLTLPKQIVQTYIIL